MYLEVETGTQYVMGDSQLRRRARAEERPDRKKRWTSKVKTGCATCRYVCTAERNATHLFVHPAVISDTEPQKPSYQVR